MNIYFDHSDPMSADLVNQGMYVISRAAALDRIFHPSIGNLQLIHQIWLIQSQFTVPQEKIHGRSMQKASLYMSQSYKDISVFSSQNFMFQNFNHLFYIYG